MVFPRAAFVRNDRYLILLTSFSCLNCNLFCRRHSCRQMIGMEQWVSKEMVGLVEDLLAKLKEDKLVPNIYTYNGVLFV